MKKFIFLIAGILAFASCNWPELVGVFNNGDDIVISPPLPIVNPDTCDTYVHINSPSYIQGYCELDNPITNYWVLYVGGSNQNAPYQDSIFPGEEASIQPTLQSMLTLYLQQYEHDVYVRSDARRINVLTKGTDNQGTLNLKVWIRADGAKWFFTFNRRCFNHAGTITDTATWMQLCNEYPSMTRFNLRDCQFDSLEEKTAMLGVLHHDLCKAGEQWADFRFNNFAPSDSIVQAFEDAGWQDVLTNVTGNPIVVRGAIVGVFKSETVADTRGYCATDEQIMSLLDQGFVVIADL